MAGTRPPSVAASTFVPAARKSRCRYPIAIVPRRGDSAALVTNPTSRSAANNRAPRCGTGPRCEGPPVTHDASVAAMQHTDDHFLADIAALGQRDGAILDAGLERNRVVGHVNAEDRIPGFDARLRSPVARRREHPHRSVHRSNPVRARLNVDDKPARRADRYAPPTPAVRETPAACGDSRPTPESGRASITGQSPSRTAGAFGPCIHTPARLSASEAT